MIIRIQFSLESSYINIYSIIILTGQPFNNPFNYISILYSFYYSIIIWIILLSEAIIICISLESTFLLREDIFLEDVQARLCVLRFGEVVCSVNRLSIEFPLAYLSLYRDSVTRDFPWFQTVKHWSSHWWTSTITFSYILVFI